MNEPVRLQDLDAVILDFGGVLYDIDYDDGVKEQTVTRNLFHVTQTKVGKRSSEYTVVST